MPAYNGPGETDYTEVSWEVDTQIAYDVGEMIDAAYRSVKEFDVGEDFFRIEADGEGHYRIWYRKDALERRSPARPTDPYLKLEFLLRDMGIYEDARILEVQKLVRKLIETHPTPEEYRAQFEPAPAQD